MEAKKNGENREESFLPKAIHIMERTIAVITLLGLAGALVFECYHLIGDINYYRDVSHLLHNLLGIVVGLEFVRMLLDTTPANIIEVLVVAITRHVVLSHENAWSNLLSIACVAALFAIRRFLIRPHEMQEDITEE